MILDQKICLFFGLKILYCSFWLGARSLLTGGPKITMVLLEAILQRIQTKKLVRFLA